MQIKRLLADFVTVFAVTFVVSVVVILLWNLIVDGASTINWETSFRFAILLGILLPWLETRRGKGEKL